MARKSKKNYLDCVPVISKENSWSEENGVVTVHMEHKGVYHWIAQRLFGRPRVSHIALDEMGSFIFPLLDGTRDVGEIALLVKEEFGENAEPLYDRLVQYMKILHNNRFIRYADKKLPKDR